MGESSREPTSEHSSQSLRPFQRVHRGSLALQFTVRRFRGRLEFAFTLKGRVAADLTQLVIPELEKESSRRRQNELWRSTCLEIFVGVPGQQSYFEINLSPSGHWNAYAFDGYRIGMREASGVRVSLNELIINSACDSLTVHATFHFPVVLTGPAEEPSGPVLTGALVLGAAAVMEYTSGEREFWGSFMQAENLTFTFARVSAWCSDPKFLEYRKIMTKLGIDVLLSSPKLRLELAGRRVALLGNPASMTGGFQHSLDALFQGQREFTVSAAFGPQHGMRGEVQDNMKETKDTIDPVYKIPVFSLYGEVRRPTEHMMNSFDVILVDLQDVGTRIYTFLTTLLYVLQEAATYRKAVWVLDRPNPAGRAVEGSRLRPGWVSFVGAAEGIPMRHGLTLGEAALWFKAKFKLDVELKVIAMEGYDPLQAPGFGWPVGEMSWVNPSPNAANLSMARCFPGTVLIEGTHLSEGRGTTHPLETVGGPGLDMDRILKSMERLAPHWLAGCRIRICYFMPTFHKHAGQIVSGLQMHVDDSNYQPDRFRPYRVVALWLKAIRLELPEYQIWRDFHYEYEKTRLAFDLINGGPSLREWVDTSTSVAADLDSICLPDEKSWCDERREFLLYRA